ncbi:MAG: DUF86 domain-containing protein [Thermoflexales bacterium]|nr:DUF86 domain-containing protein [Thermoflexales bacterium]
MGLNESLIRSRFEDIRVSLERLEELRALSREEFLAHRDRLDLACYRLIVAIEAAVQICFHVSAQKLHRVPEEYAECFSLLGEAGMISAELSEHLQRMARFWNVLVHRYWDVDYHRVYDILQNRLDDLREFVDAMS